MTGSEKASLEQPLAGALDRRDFMRASAASGFAAAVLPVHAQTLVQTDKAGLLEGDVVIPSGDARLPAYRAQPAGAKGKLPVILVVQEIFGVHEHIRDVVRRLAHAGYLAVAPQMFFRQGDPAKHPDIPTLLKEVVSRVPDAQVMADLDAAVAWAASNGGDTRRVGITGFCWGGRTTWMYCAHNPAVRAGVAWYGRVVGEANAMTPRHPVDVAASIKAPMLGLYGGADTGIPVESVERTMAALKAGGNTASELVVFKDAPHAFHADYRPSYRREAAQDAWKRCLAWFARHLA